MMEMRIGNTAKTKELMGKILEIAEEMNETNRVSCWQVILETAASQTSQILTILFLLLTS
jgi:hypothetical protein